MFHLLTTAGQDVKSCIIQINAALVDFHLEIRAIKLPNEGGSDGELCYGLVNTVRGVLSVKNPQPAISNRKMMISPRPSGPRYKLGKYCSIQCVP